MQVKFKRNLILLICMVLLLSACANFYMETEVLGNVRHVQRRLQESDYYSQQDINEAMDAVIAHFRSTFGGCSLIEIEYNEEKSVLQSDEWAKQYSTEQAIVLYSVFDVRSESAAASGLTPGETYRNWAWILVRNGHTPWQLKTWGYG
ncbi:MAG: hypothetical protein IKW00_09605 [Clostridia bacterium]|nr:hypothetical protein [Clostridia bacterium]